MTCATLMFVCGAPSSNVPLPQPNLSFSSTDNANVGYFLHVTSFTRLQPALEWKYQHENHRNSVKILYFIHVNFIEHKF